MRLVRCKELRPDYNGRTWSAFPFVPTDVICYVAGTLRMHVRKFAAGVALGELPLVAFYVWAGGIVFGR